MSDVGRPRTPRRRWLLISGVVVVAALAVAGWFTLQGTKQTAPAAAASAPPPAVGVRAASLRGVSRSFEFVGRIKAVTRWSCARASRAFSTRCSSREGQDVKAGDLLYQIEKVQFQSAQSTRPRAICSSPRPRRPMPSCEYDRQLDLVKRQYSPQSVVDQDKADLDSASGQGDADPGGADPGAGQSRLHRHPRPDRRPHRPHRLHASAISSIRRAASWRRSSARIRSTCFSRSACSDLETIREARRKEGRRPGQDRYPRPPRQRPGISAARRLELDRPAGRPAAPTALIMRATIPNPDRQC